LSAQSAQGRIDTLGMWEVTSGFPEQVAVAATATVGITGLPAAADIDNVVVLGMGGSGIAGDLAVAVAGPDLPVPLVVAKGYEAPRFTGSRTLCIAISFSGNTEETVAAATEAHEAGAHLVLIASGGRMAELAHQWEVPLVGLPDDIPMPRAGLGAVSIPVLTLLEAAGLLPGASASIERAVTQLSARRDQLVAAGSPAAALARRIGRTMPLIYGGGALGAAAALRWKNQVVENAKAPSFCAAVPELMHNDIAGWGQHGDVTRQVFTVVNLRHDYEHPRLARRFELIEEWTDEAVAGIEDVRAAGDGRLAQALDLMLFGDFVTLHMAYDAGVDPGPIAVLDAIKEALG
jgi:glucose/mannose-6-phosphate isomerase